MVTKKKVLVDVEASFKDTTRMKSVILSSLPKFKIPLENAILVGYQEDSLIVKQVAQEMDIPFEEFSDVTDDIDALVAFIHHRRVLRGDKSIKARLDPFRASGKPYRVVEY